jgi:hypothetical protein
VVDLLSNNKSGFVFYKIWVNKLSSNFIFLQNKTIVDH